MIQWILKKIIGSKNQRALKKLWPVVQQINEIETGLQSLSEDELREKTAGWKERFRAFHDPKFLGGTALRSAEEEALRECIAGLEVQFARVKEHFPQIDDQILRESEWKKSPEEEMRERIVAAREAWEKVMPEFNRIEEQLLEEILPEAYAVVKNGARRLCGKNLLVTDYEQLWEMVHFDVQLLGGIALHRGMIAEMATGEGKTLVATLPVYLNALTGRGVHVITVNDYLARRDSEWMGHLFKSLGLTVGCIQNDQPPPVRRDQYNADITYGTNSEFGFDYLRDNGMAMDKTQQVQRGHYFSIIDEVDSVLIDEARTPLIISGPVTVSTHQFDRFKPLVAQLVKKQNLLCNKLVSEGKELYERGDVEEAGKKLFQVKVGQPKNRGFMRCMEDPDIRRTIEKAELSLYQDTQKRELFALKEELYYSVEEKSHDADLSEMGRAFLNPDEPDSFVLPDLATAFSEIDGDESLDDKEKSDKKAEVEEKLSHQGQRIHNISQLLRAYCLYEKDVHYVVEDNKVIIVDENTGRKMPGRRWSDGLHQAVEAKEGVKIDKETQTLATITIQNYFRLYQKLAGMTGTAETEAAEFHDIYKLDVLVVPTNKEVKRIDYNDAIFKTRREKYNAVIHRIKECHAKGQPVLVGTASVESSETLARMLKRERIPHSILNAKYHRQEAEIVSRAGHKGAVTISTNMAGRGTDIKLGEGVPELGGLFVLGTERHISRRIDRQLRGRCARQGDPGESKFYISFEDDLMRNFGAAERMTRMMERFGLDEGQELEHKWLNRSVETAQKRVEQRDYVMRKRVLEYDDVMNQQREVVYDLRNDTLESEEPRLLIDEMVEKAIPDRVAEYCEMEDPDVEPDYHGLLNWINTNFPLRLSPEEAQLESRDVQGNADFIIEKIREAYNLRVENTIPELVDDMERGTILEVIDRLWQEHLYEMDGLRQSVHLRTYAQKDPLVEFKGEALQIFRELMNNIDNQVASGLFKASPQVSTSLLQRLMAEGKLQLRQDGSFGTSGAAAAAGVKFPTGGGGGGQAPDQLPPGMMPPPGTQQQGGGSTVALPVKRDLPKVGRNSPCPCGSGKKYKQCCGRSA